MGVILLCRNDVTIGAKINTEVTFLTKFFVYLDMTFHITSLKQFIPSCFQNPVADTPIVPFRVFRVLCGIVPIAFGYGINSTNRYFFTAFKISEFH